MEVFEVIAKIAKYVSIYTWVAWGVCLLWWFFFTKGES